MPKINELALSAVLGFASLASFADASAGSADEDSALGNNSSTEYFSVPAFFITFRETIEVCSWTPTDYAFFVTATIMR